MIEPMASENRIHALARGADATRKVPTFPRQAAAAEVEAGGAMADVLDQRENAAQWPTLVREVFGELYGLGVEPIEPVSGSEWIGTVLDQAAELPEWRTLRERSEGDAWRSGMSTDLAIDALGEVLDRYLEQAPEQDPAEAAEEAQERAQEAQELADRGASPAQVAKAQERAQEAEEWAKECLTKALELNSALTADGGAAVRTALRGAAATAHDEIDRIEAAMMGMGAGDGAGCLTRMRATPEQIQAALRKNPQLVRIATVAGRVRLSARRVQASKAKIGGAEELCDTEIGGDLQRWLPSEVMMFAGADTELLAFSRLIDRNGMQYQMSGRERVERGPIMFLVDSSASMSGKRIEWAAGVALAMAEVAGQQRRAVAIAHYTTEVVKLDVFEPRGVELAKLIDSVCYFAAGGTHIAQSLRSAHQWLKSQPVMKGADVVLVSDGLEGGSFAPEIRAMADDGVRTFGVAIGSVWPSDTQEACAGYHAITDRDIAAGDDSKIESVLGI